VEDDPARGLGRALAWADGRGAAHLQLLVEAEGGLLARRAALFARPPLVWTVEGRALRPTAPEPHQPPPAVPAELEPLRAVIESAGADVAEENGELAGEVAGLEVCRAVIADDGLPRLEVGIGPHDREAFRLVHPDEAVGPALAGLVALVAEHRRPGAPAHALNRIARERYLRWRLVREPSLIGLDELRPATPPVPRRSLKEATPCAAVGSMTGAPGPIVVVCSVGVDLDVVPFAADARDALAGPSDRLVIAVPVEDDLPVTRTLAARLAVPAEVVTVPPESPSP
jgi:hypothetical protein